MLKEVKSITKMRFCDVKINDRNVARLFLPCVAIFTKKEFQSNPFALTQCYENNYNNLYLNFWRALSSYISPPRGEAHSRMRVGSPSRRAVAFRNAWIENDVHCKSHDYQRPPRFRVPRCSAAP